MVSLSTPLKNRAKIYNLPIRYGNPLQGKLTRSILWTIIITKRHCINKLTQKTLVLKTITLNTCQKAVILLLISQQIALPKRMISNNKNRSWAPLLKKGFCSRELSIGKQTISKRWLHHFQRLKEVKNGPKTREHNRWKRLKNSPRNNPIKIEPTSTTVRQDTLSTSFRWDQK